MSRFLTLALGALICLGPSARAENLLKDPGFEFGTDNESFDPAWERFGNVYHEPFTPRSGNWICKLFGNFTTELNHSGIQQDLPAEAGARYRASIYFRHNEDDRLQGSNKGWLRLEFFDAGGQKLDTVDSDPFSADANTERYKEFTIENATAPEGTERVRYVILFEQQSDNAPGALFCDDALLETSSGPM